MKRVKEALHEDYLRSLMFGLQDGIVSTTGVVVGISTGVSNKEIIILRRREDSNLCESCDSLGFRDRPNKPLLHSSGL